MTSCDGAEPISTTSDWEDLVLDAQARRAVEDIVSWQQNRRQLEHGTARGLAVLFCGPAGSGMAAAAGLIAGACGRPAWRVDLAALVCKYAGETEKNLARILDHATSEDWILFFDGADALFGKRGEAGDANDRAANQQVAYLLQRIEDFPGVVILTTKLRSHLDEAFARRFQSVIRFGAAGG